MYTTMLFLAVSYLARARVRVRARARVGVRVRVRVGVRVRGAHVVSSPRLTSAARC